MKFVHLALLAAVVTVDAKKDKSGTNDHDKKVKNAKKNKPSGCKVGIKMEAFKDSDCTKGAEIEGKKGVKKFTAKELEKYDNKCFKTSDKTSTFVTCDHLKGISIKSYKNTLCNGDDDESLTYKWGYCKKFQGSYYKATGAMALKSAALAAAAFIGSQF